METLKLYTCREGYNYIKKGRTEGKTYRSILNGLTRSRSFANK